MKLHSLWIGDYRNLRDIELTFPPQPRLPIHLVVGINGTGKSGLLRVIAHIFRTLEYSQAPHIPFRAEYQIGRGEENWQVRIKGDGSGTVSGITFEVANAQGEFSPRERSEWADFLPARTVVYTSGNLAEWQPIFAEAITERERWESDQAEALRSRQDSEAHIDEVATSVELKRPSPVIEEVIPSRTLLLTPPHLQLALLATLALKEAADADLRSEIYQRAKLDQLTRFALRLEPLSMQDGGRQSHERLTLLIQELLVKYPDDPDLQKRLEELNKQGSVLPPRPMELVRKLAELAARRHRNPDGSYHLLFDMTPEIRLGLGGDKGLFPTPMEFYEFLADLYERGVLAGVDLVIRKTDLPDEILDHHLSDGEYDFLGRMALFLLLCQPESLFLLDEPESHFNDVWKRELVDILAMILKDQPSTVLLTTHSSIVVSDVSADQVTLLKKDEQGRTRSIDIRTPTLGADPSEIMIQVLEAPDSIGQDALDYLDDQLKRDWKPEDREELEKLIRTVGPGYHRSELRTIWRKLNAPQN